MAGGAALEALQAGLHEDVSLEIVLPAARAVLAGGPPEMQGCVRGYLQETLSRIAQGTADEKIRVAWLTGPVGRELVELAGPDGPARPADWRARVRGGRADCGHRRDRAPAAPAADRRQDERRDRRRDRLHRGGSGRAAGPSVRPARRLEPRRGDVARVPRARHGRVLR